MGACDRGKKYREKMKKKGADNSKLVGSPFIVISEILLIGQTSECLENRSNQEAGRQAKHWQDTRGTPKAKFDEFR